MLGANGTITSPADLPSASFSPPPKALPINILFSVSLTLALLASFLAVLGQQWLVYYRKRSGGGAEYQRWEQLRRYLGAKRWKLELVLDDVLPSVLQVGLVIFCVAFILYLGTLSDSLCYAVIGPVLVAGALILAMAIFSAWDRWCPFKSPLSHLAEPCLKYSIELVGRLAAIPALSIAFFSKFATDEFRSQSILHDARSRDDSDGEPKGFRAEWLQTARNITERFQGLRQRDAEGTDQLKLVALRRVVCTSEDPTALTHAAMNTQSITERSFLRQILDDKELRTRFKVMSDSWDPEITPDNLQLLQGRAITSALFHILFSAGSLEEFIPSSAAENDQDPVDIQSATTSLLDGLTNAMFLGQRIQYPPFPADCANCQHCNILQYCLHVLTLIGNDFRTDFLKLDPKGFEEELGEQCTPTSVGPVWLVAWVIKMSFEWKAVSSQEHQSNPELVMATWKLQTFRDFLRTYQEM